MTPTDIRLCLRADHDRVLSLARLLMQEPAPHRMDRFAELRDVLARHQQAGEAVVYPALRSLRMPYGVQHSGGATENDTCDRLVNAMATRPMPAPKWRAMAKLLLNLLTLHAREQHRLLLPLLSHRLSPGAREQLGLAYQRVLAAPASGQSVPAAVD
jgi:hypothetical protein